jgi:hypothetical protein
MTLAYQLTLKKSAMKTFVKNYIGKGKKVDGLEIIKITLKAEDLMKFTHKYKDEDYINIEVAKLKSADKFGHEYTVYVNRLEEKPDEAPEKSREAAKVKKPRSKKATIPNEDLPF